ncbi:ptzH [Candidatus Endolissoclinum faulkneri L2]|uniref:PtzH n=1 Tax=Candidatus Endolissoclinum faulkneri L2 TaxID=1193729 RepID=K7YM77_9PROT|nr:beta-ketoacyl synthase N-terminal-like domain-containing protein [Candidatus Endolissoclinum faulkneri]AFX98612.1 ptzH [Candidatus Endolissoclinum faulkneri L2]
MNSVGILGYGAVTPFGFNVNDLTAGLRYGQTKIQELKDSEWPNGSPLRTAALIPTISDSELLDKISLLLPNITKRMRHDILKARRSLRIGLLAAAEALAQYGSVGKINDNLALVVAGSNLFSGALSEAEARRLSRAYPSARHGVEMFDTHAVALISEVFSCRGYGITAGAASASGIAALIIGIDLLKSGRAEYCLIVGMPADLGAADWLGINMIGAMADSRILPDDSLCRPFDKAASGFVPGEMAGAVLLGQPESTNLRITGSALRLSGSSQPNPSLESEIRVMREALISAELVPKELDLVSAHATSTPLGDATEADAITKLIGENTCVNAPKGLIGHGLNVAGLVETIVVVSQITNGFLHPNLNLESPVKPLRYIGAVAIEQSVNKVLKSSFGFGGFNASIVVEKCA